MCLVPSCLPGAQAGLLSPWSRSYCWHGARSSHWDLPRRGPGGQLPPRGCARRPSGAESRVLLGPACPQGQCTREQEWKWGHWRGGECASAVRSAAATGRMGGNGPGDCAKSSVPAAAVLQAGTPGSGSAWPAAGPAQPACPMIMHPTECWARHEQTSSGKHPSTHGSLDPVLCPGHGCATAESWAQGPAVWRQLPEAHLGW